MSSSRAFITCLLQLHCDFTMARLLLDFWAFIKLFVISQFDFIDTLSILLWTILLTSSPAKDGHSQSFGHRVNYVTIQKFIYPHCNRITRVRRQIIPSEESNGMIKHADEHHLSKSFCLIKCLLITGLTFGTMNTSLGCLVLTTPWCQLKNGEELLALTLFITSETANRGFQLHRAT